MIFAVVGRAGSGHEAVCTTGVRSVQGWGSKSWETLLNHYNCPTTKVAAKIAAKVRKFGVSLAATLLVTCHASFISADDARYADGMLALGVPLDASSLSSSSRTDFSLSRSSARASAEAEASRGKYSVSR